ncbi:hypothetical protein TNCV_781651 [Trichonephila clavipes]|nr:hypothetical protein TNCV_781651 [Trichonephila clavipes]
MKYGCCEALKDQCGGGSYSAVKTTSFHSAAQIFHISGGDVCGSASMVDQTMDVLLTYHSAVNGVEWYAQTLNDALQAQCAMVRDVTERSVTAMRTICLFSREVVH